MNILTLLNYAPGPERFTSHSLLGNGFGDGLMLLVEPFGQNIDAEAPFTPFPNAVRTGDNLGRGIAAQRTMV